MPEPAQLFVARKRAEGKSTFEALHCLKSHLARTVWQSMRSVDVRRQAVLTDACPSTEPALAMAS